jgi:tetratricopeptide (TPR) repeat protein
MNKPLSFPSIKNIETTYECEFDKDLLIHEQYILQLFNGIVSPVPATPDILNDLLYITGGYYSCFSRDYAKMKEYYLVAYGNKCQKSMIGLAMFSYQSENNPELAEKYFKDAVKLGNSKAMQEYGKFKQAMKEEDEAIRLYRLAMKKGNKQAMVEYAMTFNITPYEKYMVLQKCKTASSYIELGKLHDKIGNVKEAEKFYTLATKTNDYNAVHGYIHLANIHSWMASHYVDMDNVEMEERHRHGFKTAFEEIMSSDYVPAYMYFADFYAEIMGDEEKEIMCLEGAEKLDCLEAISRLAYSAYKKGDINAYEKYMEKGISLNCRDIICDYAKYQGSVKKDFAKMKELYLHGIALHSTNASAQLANHYINVEHDVEQAKKYHIICLENYDSTQEINHTTIFDKYKPIELYLLLNNLKNKNHIVTNKLKELRNSKIVCRYHNVLANSEKFNIIADTCLICHEEEKKGLTFDCGHICCVDCYVKVEVCPVCK